MIQNRLHPYSMQLLCCAASVVGLLVIGGCQLSPSEIQLPDTALVARGQLLVHSDFHIPRKHRLLDDLVARRADISKLLDLPTSDEPINIYLFKMPSEFREYMHREHPLFPDRRAFFIKDDTELKVLAFWGQRVAEDLRHEVTHGYLHGVVPSIPLWLDEGIAEFFEAPRGKHGFNHAHVYQLANAFRRGDWSPDLQRLELLDDPAAMNQMDYAEAWLWVHFLLENEEYRGILQTHLARLREDGESPPLSESVKENVDEYDAQVVMHLKALGEKLLPTSDISPMTR